MRLICRFLCGCLLIFFNLALVVAAQAQFVSRGEWSPTETYQIDDLVTHRGSAWRGLDVSQNQMPGRTGANSTAPFWQLFTRGYNNAGAWNATTMYHRDDIVTLGGSSWRAKQTVRMRKPDLINSAAFWEPVALGTLPRGAWDAATVYDLGDIVTFDGASFRAIRASGNVNREPSGPRLGTFWELAVARGLDGPSGPPGLDGAPGAIGPPGPQGPAGADGAIGAQGPKGDTGDAGPQGLAGAVGPVGPVGPEGPTGPTGAQGAKGDTGDAGPQGLAGAVGPAGPVGPEGPTGPTGAQGAKGDTGDAGPQGLAGAVGPAGPVGPEGPAGPMGAQGAKGDTGDAGPQGAAGTPGAIIKVSFVQGNEQTVNNTSNAGGGWVQGSPGLVPSRELSFTKLQASSLIKITYSDNLRTSSGSNCAAKWTVNLDGNATGVYTSLYSGGINIHRGTTVVGYVPNVAIGSHQITIGVGQVPQPGLPLCQVVTGWSSTFSITVEEITQ